MRSLVVLSGDSKKKGEGGSISPYHTLTSNISAPSFRTRI